MNVPASGPVGARADDVRVVVVEDQELVRAGFVALIQAEPGLVVAGTAARGDDAVSVVRRTRPDVVLMDIRMPGMDGIEALRRIRADPLLEDVRVVVLTTFGVDEYVFSALRAGARGFLLKDTPPDRLLTAVRQVAAGGVVLGDGLVGRVVEELVRVSPASAAPPPRLTRREAEILALVCEGLTNRQIAHQLRIGEATVKTYVSRLLSAFGVDTRVLLAARAATMRSGGSAT
jgi:DNA-binding NarL/FixJ family response regulator